MPRFLLTIQYLGTSYSGWQTQLNAVGIQQVVEQALSDLLKSPVRIEGAGRTDAGVHAAGQKAHGDLPFDIEVNSLIQGVNNLLPPDIRVLAAVEVDPAFHCRFRATGKTYLYQIWNDRVRDVFHSATHAHVAPRLDVAAMSAAASRLVGHHDFKAFTVASPEVSSTWRTIDQLTVIAVQKRILITARGNGFLRFMVRRIAGSLIRTGRGRLTPDEVASSLEPDFAPARWTAPPHGLTLTEVRYGD